MGGQVRVLVLANSHGVNARGQQMQDRLEVPLLAAALLTIPAVALEASGLGEPWGTIALVLNWVIWFAFLFEAVAMLWVVDDRWKWVRTHPLEVAIVLFTAPLLPASLQAARVFRLLRLLRLLRVAVLARRVFSTEGVRDAAVLAAIGVLGGGAAFSAVERTDAQGRLITAWDGVWWAVTTVTTVGYGDYAPRTDAGRMIAICVMVIGIGFVAILTAAAAERFVRADRRGDQQRQEILDGLATINERLDRLEQPTQAVGPPSPSR